MSIRRIDETLQDWAIQEIACYPMYDGSLGARNVVIGWRCRIINRGWYEGSVRDTLEDAINSAIKEMDNGNDAFKHVDRG